MSNESRKNWLPDWLSKWSGSLPREFQRLEAEEIVIDRAARDAVAKTLYDLNEQGLGIADLSKSDDAVVKERAEKTLKDRPEEKRESVAPVPPTSERFVEITNKVYEEEYDDFMDNYRQAAKGTKDI